MRILGAFFTVTDLLRRWQYAVPLVVNLTGSVWFFVVVGRAGRFTGFLLVGWEGVRCEGMMDC